MSLQTRNLQILIANLVRSTKYIEYRSFASAAALILLVLSIFGFAPVAAAATCPLSTVNPSVTVCTPTPNQWVGTPAHIVAGSTDSNPVIAMQIYVDNQLIYKVQANALDTYINLALGNHLLTVQAWDNTGRSFKTDVAISMTPPCALNTQNQTVTICTPGDGETVSSPVHLVAGATDSTPVRSMQVWVDGKKTYEQFSAPLDVYLTTLTPGAHRIGVQAYPISGPVFKAVQNIVVSDDAGLDNIRHIIFYVQENRSFDNYFGMLGPYRASEGLPADIDGLDLNVALPDTQGNPVKPFHFQTVCQENLSPFWNESYHDVDGGLMDGFLRSSTSVPSSIDPYGTRAMGYYDQTDLPYYYELATQFATSDRFFSPLHSNTNANRMYLFAGTSFGHIRADKLPAGGWTQPTIFDHLDQAGVSWSYYYQDNGAYLPQWSTYTRDASKMKPIADWYNDIQNEATLPSVIFIERAGPSGLDEHPGSNIQAGAANNEKIINALLNSPSWASSVFILTYDEAGGLHDHVVPASTVAPDNIPPMLLKGDEPGDFTHTGFRVPVIVISPWVRPNYVSHTWRDYTSILRLIEDRFNVAPLTARDASSDDMSGFFDFTTPHWLTPPPLPDQPTNGTCNDKLETAPPQ
jgi:phospholipase C